MMKKTALSLLILGQLLGTSYTFTVEKGCTAKKRRIAFYLGLTYILGLSAGITGPIYNIADSTTKPVTLHAFPDNATLPQNPNCEYLVSSHCSGVDNRQECDEFRDANGGEVYIERCIGEEETDHKKQGLASGPLVSRVLQVGLEASIVALFPLFYTLC